MQLTHHNTTFKKQTFPITLVCDGIKNAANIGSLFRLADAFGVKELIFCGKDFELGKRFRKTSRATEQYVNYSIQKDINSILGDLKAAQYQLIALEITTKSQPISTLQINAQTPIALIVGNENYGISASVLKQSDVITHIKMYGHNSSMNVAQATSIALYEIVKQLNP